MNIEIEIKVIVKNVEQVRNYLSKFARKTGNRSQTDVYYVKENCDFFDEKPVYRYLRIRFDKKSSLDYHICHLTEDKKLLFTEELETGVDKPKVLSQIFENIGLVKRVTVEKDREIYHLRDYTIVLDKIKKLGNFLEIEVVSDSAKTKKEVKAIKDSCYGLLLEIGAKWEKAPEMGYPDMILQQKEKS